MGGASEPWMTGRPNEAEGPLREALAFQKQLAAEFPSEHGYRQELATIHNNLGNLLKDTNRRKEAEEAYRVVEALVGQMLARLAITAAQTGGNDAAPSEESALLRRFCSRAPAARWAALRGEIEESFARTDALNLDRKQTILGAFFAIERAAG